MNTATRTARPILPLRLLLSLRTFAIATLLSLTPITAVILLGWVLGYMRHAAHSRAGLVPAPADRPAWLLGPPGHGLLTRLFGGLARNIATGLRGALALFAATFPFALFWLFAWWAGWENSFNKGYEQAFVGPMLGFGGVAVFALTMVWLPMGMAHMAFEARASALFDWARIRSAVRHAGLRYVFLALATLILALPLFAARGLPIFAENIAPQIAVWSAEEIAELRNRIDLATGAYIVLALLILKRWTARLYADAVARAARSADHGIWTGHALAPVTASASPAPRPWRIARLIRLALLLAIWTAFAFLIFVGQFLNHDWHVWLSHPLVFLPWVP